MAAGGRSEGAGSLGREAVGGRAAPDRGYGATSPGVAVSLPPLTRDSGLSGQPCVMCDHPRVLHTAGTDGAGWCGEASGCECGGFQSANTLSR
jgi:hypothetical protein